MDKILIFNGYYYPSTRSGGPQTSIRNVVDSCFDKYEFYIVCYNHDFGSKEIYKNIHEGWNNVGKAKVLYIDEKKYNYNSKNIKTLLDEIEPSLIWFSGILRPEIRLCTINIARKKTIPVLMSSRGEASSSRMTIKGYKKLPYAFFIRLFKVYRGVRFHVTSLEEKTGLTKYFNPPENQIYLVSNIGVVPKKIERNVIKRVNELRITFLSRIHMVKNLDFALNLLKEVNRDIKITYDIYGPIESDEYWERCTEIIDNLPSNINVNYKGILTPFNISEAFCSYHCFLFPTINENYGHVIAESLRSGCPIILSKNTTPWDDCDQIGGYVCDLEDKNCFVTKIEKIASMNQKDYDLLSVNTVKYYKRKFDRDSAKNGHLDMFSDIIKEGKV